MDINKVMLEYSPVSENRAENLKEGFGGLGGDEFMQLLLIQLQNQNPLEPMNDNELLAQFTQLNSLDQLQKINENLISLARSDDLLNAAGLIGRVIEAKFMDGEPTIGAVDSVSMSEGEVMLWIGDQGVSLSSVVSVREE